MSEGTDAPAATAVEVKDPLEAFAGLFKSRHESWLMRDTWSRSHQSNRASAIGDPCERRLYLWRTAGDQAAEMGPSVRAILGMGTELEPIIRRRLEALGFQVTATGTAFPSNKYEISGTTDVVLLHEGRQFIGEIKSINGYDFETLNTAQDLADSRKAWLRKWLDQTMLYLYLAETTEARRPQPIAGAVLILFSKQSGELKAIPIRMDYDRVQGLLDKADRLNEAVRTQTPPAFLTDPVECRRCPFFSRACFPPLDFGEGMNVHQDQDLEEALDRREELAPAGKEYASLDRRVKDRVKAIADGKSGLWSVGRWVIQTTKRDRKGYEVKPFSFLEMDFTTLVDGPALEGGQE